MIPAVSAPAGRTLLSILMLTLFAGGCRKVIKTKVRVETAPAHRQALESTLPELIQWVNTTYAGMESLVAKMSLGLEVDSPDENFQERYRKAPAQLISRRPGSIRIHVLSPLGNTLAALTSSQGRFQIWAPRENKFFTGSTKLKRRHDNPLYNVRPEHVLPAILIEPLPVGPAARVFLLEEEDANSKYYVIYELHSRKLRPKRRLWIERSRLALVRQEYYDEGGGVVSSIRHTSPITVGKAVVNVGIELERPRDGYTLRLQLKKESLNLGRKLEERHFQLSVPPGARLVTLQ